MLHQPTVSGLISWFSLSNFHINSLFFGKEIEWFYQIGQLFLVWKSNFPFNYCISPLFLIWEIEFLSILTSIQWFGFRYGIVCKMFQCHPFSGYLVCVIQFLCKCDINLALLGPEFLVNYSQLQDRGNIFEHKVSTIN